MIYLLWAVVGLQGLGLAYVAYATAYNAKMTYRQHCHWRDLFKAQIAVTEKIAKKLRALGQPID